MYRYDYVLRLIERLGQILRTLRDRLLRREMTHEDLHAEIQEIARDYLQRLGKPPADPADRP